MPRGLPRSAATTLRDAVYADFPDDGSYRDKLDTAFRQAQDEGVIRPIRLELFLPMVRGAIGALVRTHITGRALVDDDTIEDAISVFWSSIAIDDAGTTGSR